MRIRTLLARAFVVCFLVSCFVPALAVWANQNPAPLTDSNLGRFPLFTGKIETKMDLYYIVTEYQSRIKNSIELGSGGQVDAGHHTALIEKAVKSDVGVTETNLPTDAIIVWMGFESRSKIQVIRDRIWKGEPLPGFLIRIQDQGKEYAYFFPKKCGNLSFVGERILEPPPKAELPPPSPTVEEKVKIVEKIIIKEVPVEIEKIVEVPVEVFYGQPQVVYVPQPQQEQQIPWWEFLPPPPPIVIGGGYSGRQEYCESDWRWQGSGGRGHGGRGGRGGQPINVINNIQLDNSSYSSSSATGGNAYATGGRVDFNSNIKNTNTNNNSNWQKQDQRQGQGQRRYRQQCPTGQTCPTDTPNSRPAPRTVSDLSSGVSSSGRQAYSGNGGYSSGRQAYSGNGGYSSGRQAYSSGRQSYSGNGGYSSGRQAYSSGRQAYSGRGGRR